MNPGSGSVPTTLFVGSVLALVLHDCVGWLYGSGVALVLHDCVGWLFGSAVALVLQYMIVCAGCMVLV